MQARYDLISQKREESISDTWGDIEMTDFKSGSVNTIDLSLDINPHLQSKIAFYWLWSACWVMVVFDYLFAYRDITGAYVFRRVFSMTREETVANWYASILLFLIALTCFALSLFSKGDKTVSRPWLIFSGFFLYLSADDGARIHERLGSFFRDLAEESQGMFGFFDQVLFFTGSYAWLVFVLPVFVVMGLYMLRWGHKHITERATREFVMIGIVCLSFAIGLDYFEGLVGNDTINVDAWPIEKNTIEHFQRVLEEFLEMTAFLLVLRGLWVHSLIQCVSAKRQM